MTTPIFFGLSPTTVLCRASSRSQRAAERAKCEELWQRPVRKLVADGLCINRLWAQPARNSDLVEIKRAYSSSPLPQNHSFSRGDVVRLQTEPATSGGVPKAPRQSQGSELSDNSGNSPGGRNEREKLGNSTGIIMCMCIIMIVMARNFLAFALCETCCS